MEFIELIIIIAILVTFSNIVSKILPSVPIFFIQIILGILLGLTEMGQEIAFEPEMFLVMIIGPLLFREGERADVPEILKNSKIVLFLAFGGVLLTLFAVGTTLHWLMPIDSFGCLLCFWRCLRTNRCGSRLIFSETLKNFQETSCIF